ncbi:MAG: zf-TFIIB domain-containing protein, partial [Thermoplasmata archaeon]
MTRCPECRKNLKKERREISPGIYAQVEVCTKCKDEWLDESEYEKLRALFKRKVFKIGGSLAVR